MATKKAIYQYDNGSGWDEIMFKTTADQVVESSSRRFVSDSEKSKWNGKAEASHTHNYAGSSSVGGAATTALVCTGNSATTTKLATSRTINGTSFNGSANITTANWGTARTIKIGDSGKSVNGSGNVSWSLSEIGAMGISKIGNSSYWGMNIDNSEDGWLRVPSTGLLPNIANGDNNNGGSSLGTATWRFSTIYATAINLNGSADVTGVVKTLNSFNINDKAKFGVGTDDSYWYNATSGKYLQFKNNGLLCLSGKVIGDPSYPVLSDSPGSWWSRIAPVKKDGVIDIGKYLDFHDSNGGTNDYDYRIMTNNHSYGNISKMTLEFTGAIIPLSNGGAYYDIGSPSRRWNSVYAANGTIQTSDKKHKENIVYLDDQPNTIELSSKQSSTPFKDFLKNDFKVATFTMVGDSSDEKSIKEARENPTSHQIGFIAQDIVDTEIGSTFIYNMENTNEETAESDSTLMYSTSGYITVVAKALQEEIREKDTIINEMQLKINDLTEKLNKLMTKL